MSIDALVYSGADEHPLNEYHKGRLIMLMNSMWAELRKSVPVVQQLQPVTYDEMDDFNYSGVVEYLHITKCSAGPKVTLETTED